MTDSEHFAWGLCIGFILGFLVHQIILQIAYRLEIVKYQGVWK